MDGGSFRSPRPTDRGVVNRTEQTAQRQQVEEPRPLEPVSTKAPQQTHIPTQRITKEEKPRKRVALPIIAIIVLGIVIIAGIFAFTGNKSGGLAIDSSKYQAVFFTNGQVYFGKLQAFNDDYLKLTDIYYLQTQSTDATDSENPQETSTDQANPQLIKLGDEIHGPEDEMVISKDQLLFYENLKADGKVAQSIAKFKKD